MNRVTPWILENKNQPVTELTLYSLKHVYPLLHLFTPSDKIAISAIRVNIFAFKLQSNKTHVSLNIVIGRTRGIKEFVGEF